MVHAYLSSTWQQIPPNTPDYLLIYLPSTWQPTLLDPTWQRFLALQPALTHSTWQPCFLETSPCGFSYFNPCTTTTSQNALTWQPNMTTHLQYYPPTWPSYLPQDIKTYLFPPNLATHERKHTNYNQTNDVTPPTSYVTKKQHTYTNKLAQS